MTNQTPVRDFEKMMIRLPPGMREMIANAATESGRSMNAEVVARLERSFGSGTIEERLDAYEDAIAAHDSRLDNIYRDIEDLQQAIMSLRGR